MTSGPVLKCVVVGDGAVGKTSLLMSYATNQFPTKYVPTVFDNYAVKVNVADQEYTLGLYDTAGQEGYDRLRPLTYNNTNVFLVCFSVVIPASFENIKEKWIPEIKHFLGDAQFLLIGTQVDARSDPEVLVKLVLKNSKPIYYDDGENLARSVKAVKYVECSARTMKGVKDVFDEAILASLVPKEKKKFKCTLL